ncbi:uncharacterized protein LOC144582617 [Callithrix jacchus]
MGSVECRPESGARTYLESAQDKPGCVQPPAAARGGPESQLPALRVPGQPPRLRARPRAALREQVPGAAPPRSAQESRGGTGARRWGSPGRRKRGEIRGLPWLKSWTHGPGNERMGT